MKPSRKNLEPAETPSVREIEKTNLGIKKTLKHPAIQLAREFGYTLSEFVNLVLEIELVKNGKIKRPHLEELMKFKNNS